MSRTTNAPPSIRPTRRSVSPDTAPRSAIPLFNTSAKRRMVQLADYDPMSLDSSLAASPAGSDLDMDEGGGSAAALDNPAGAAPKKSGNTLKEKIRVAREGMKDTAAKSKSKLAGAKGQAAEKGTKAHVLQGVDYLKLHASRPGGAFKKKLR